ncbi:hypothetical protein FJZ33_09700 [Candidatus Poribacteria bacterium]|nr:hypothetical protein [Candidatus Poribacteria bacterium]
MAKIEIQIDEETLTRMSKVASFRGCTVEDLIKDIIERFELSEDSLLGIFADEPEFIDQIIESTMKAREKHPLRLSNG